MKKIVLLILVVAVAVGGYVLYRRSKTIPVTVDERKARVGDLDITVRTWYGRDRVRVESKAPGDTRTFIVRLDKQELWSLDDKSKTCTIRKVEELRAAAKKLAELALNTARQDPAWQEDLPALERYLRGQYDVRVSPDKVSRSGYECTEIGFQLGTVVRIRALVASDERIPDSAMEARDLVAIFSAREIGEAERHWQQKQREFGNLVVALERTERGVLNGGTAQMSQSLVRVDVQRVDRALFEIPEDYSLSRKSLDTH